MSLVDSCGWVEYLTDGANADYFAPAIEDTAHLLVPTICLLEVFKLTLRERGENAALRSLVTMRRGRVVDLDAVIAVEAARLSLEVGLPLADSIILATARAHEAVVWTQDADLEGIDGVRYTPA